MVFKADKVPVVVIVGEFGFTVIVKANGVPPQLTPCVMKLPSELGPVPTLMVAITVFVAVLITEILPEPEFTTYTLLPSGLTDMPIGTKPTAMVVIISLVAVLITETLFGV